MQLARDLDGAPGVPRLAHVATCKAHIAGPSQRKTTYGAEGPGARAVLGPYGASFL